MTKSAKNNLFIEALPLTTKGVSGIGHLLSGLVGTMDKDESFYSHFVVTLFGPKSATERIKQWGYKHANYKSYKVKQKVVSGLNLAGLLTPADRWLGKGVYLFGNYVNYPLTKKSKSITIFHDFCYLRHPELVRPKVRRILTRNVPKWIRRTTAAVTISEFSKKELAHYYKIPSDQITVVPAGVDLTFFRPRSESEIESVKRKYGLPENYVLFLSNIEPRKNLERLVKAHTGLPAELRKEYPLVIVGGEGWLDEGIKQAITEAGSAGNKIIRPKSYVGDEDLPALYSGATALVHPAIYEGFGIPPLQAMACGTPVIVANTSSLPEVVGDNGLYIDPLSQADITDKITSLLTSSELRKELSKKGQEQARKYTLEKSLAKLSQVIDSLGA